MKRRRLKKGKSPFGGKEGLIREPTIDPRRAGFLPFARVVPATSICRDSSGVYRQLPDPANFCLLGAIGPARRLPCYGTVTVPVIDNNLSPSRLLPKFLKLCRILLNRARNERVKEGGVQKGEKRRIVENKVRACSPFFSFTTFVSRCDVALPLLLPHPFFSSPFFVGDRPCCCTRAPPNRITARGKRNFQKE